MDGSLEAASLADLKGGSYQRISELLFVSQEEG
jgi:hypothetical protein